MASPNSEWNIKIMARPYDKSKIRPREWRFLNAYIENGGNAIQAAAKARGYNLKKKSDYYAAAKWAGTVIVKLRPTISEQLEALGLTDRYLAEVALEGLQATRSTIHGEIVEDHPTRHKFFESVNKLKGNFPKAEMDINLNAKTGVVVVPGLATDEMEWLQAMEKFRSMIGEMKKIDVDGK